MVLYKWDSLGVFPAVFPVYLIAGQLFRPEETSFKQKSTTDLAILIFFRFNGKFRIRNAKASAEQNLIGLSKSFIVLEP